jgi:hypothetical protein
VFDLGRVEPVVDLSDVGVELGERMRFFPFVLIGVKYNPPQIMRVVHLHFPQLPVLSDAGNHKDIPLRCQILLKLGQAVNVHLFCPQILLPLLDLRYRYGATVGSLPCHHQVGLLLPETLWRKYGLAAFMHVE